VVFAPLEGIVHAHAVARAAECAPFAQRIFYAGLHHTAETGHHWLKHKRRWRVPLHAVEVAVTGNRQLERARFLSPGVLEDRITATDQKALLEPFTQVRTYRRASPPNDELRELSCAEGLSPVK
jgi:hypothetical protein